MVIVSLILLSELSARTAGGAITGLRTARRHPLDDRRLGNIADILYRRGDYDEATAPQTKRLRANEDLGDLDGLKAAKWEPARIDNTRVGLFFTSTARERRDPSRTGHVEGE